MLAPLSDVLSGTETSSMVTKYPSLAAPRASVPSTSSALGLATRLISATGSPLPTDLVEWTATPTRSPFHSMTTAPTSFAPMSRNERLTGLGLGLRSAVPPPPVDYLSPPWTQGRRVFSDGKPSPGDREYHASPFGYPHELDQRPYSSLSNTSRRQPSESAADRNGEIPNQVDDAQGCPRRPRILMDARQSALLNALWAKVGVWRTPRFRYDHAECHLHCNPDLLPHDG
jgi:hypothetical protein